jgi:hypothetical protein
MINLIKRFISPSPEPKKLVAKVWTIDPVNQRVTEISNPNLPSLVDETCGDDAECYRLDGTQNVVWMSDTDSNQRYAYYWEGMDFPFDVRRCSKAIVVSLGPNYWSVETINDYLRFLDKQNFYGDV